MENDGMWVLSSSRPFEGNVKIKFTVKFTRNITYMSAGLIDEEQYAKHTTVDFGRDFRVYMICKQTLSFDLDMSRRRCSIKADNKPEKVYDNLPARVWLACSMKSECTCVISR